MEFGILGPVTAGGGLGPLPAASPQVRSLLAVLLLESGRSVSEERLIEALWGDNPPATAKAALQNLVLRLRRMLGASDAERVRRTHDGYLIEVGSGDLDLHRFEQLRRTGTAHLDAGRWRAAAGDLSAALALWRGAPLADVLPSVRDAVRLDHLGEARLQTVELQARAWLRLGRYDEVVAMLAPVVREHPWRESLHGSLMHALHGAGRQADALAVYQDLRSNLIGELGIEPSAKVADLHQRILVGDPALTETGGPGDSDAAAAAAGAESPPRSRAASPVPRQLQASPRYFTGRSDVLAAMSRAACAEPGAVLALIGPGGIGKTTAALSWSHQMAGRFPDGQLYANLLGFDPAADPAPPREVIAGFLRALGVADPEMPVAVADRAALYRTLVADKRVLVVLDNAADAGQVRELLPGGPGCLTLVTSRNQLAGLVVGEGAQPFRLDPLSAAEAFELFGARLGADRVRDGREAFQALTAACAGLPLALAILAARLALEPDLDAADLAARLADGRGKLAEMEVAETATDLRAVFSWSFRRLSPVAAALFVRLGLHPGPSVSRIAAAALVAVPRSDAESALRELVGAHLLAATADGRLHFHDLIGLYAADLADAELDGPTRQDVRQRMLDHYLHSAASADRVINPARDLTPPGLVAPGQSETFADAAAAAAWLEREREVLTAVIKFAIECCFDAHALPLSRILVLFLIRSGDWLCMVDILEQAITSAERLGDAAALAWALCDAGGGRWRIGDFEPALAHLSRAREVSSGIADDRKNLCRIERNLALICDARGEHAEALEHGLTALSIIAEVDDILTEGACLGDVAWFYAACGRYDEALDHAERAVVLDRRAQNDYAVVHALHTMGVANHRLGRLDEALDLYLQVASGFEAGGDPYNHAEVLTRIAEIHRQEGREAQSRASAEAARSILDRLRIADDDPVRKALVEF